MELIELKQSHFPALLDIYKQGQNTGIATFETQLPSWESWDKSHLDFGRLAAFKNGNMLGWTALSPVSTRAVYSGVAELSIYISQDERGKGIGSYLLTHLIKVSETNKIWTLQSGIFGNNTASIHLHEKCGFRKVGYREKIAKRDGVWHDNILMERRSTIV